MGVVSLGLRLLFVSAQAPRHVAGVLPPGSCPAVTPTPRPDNTVSVSHQHRQDAALGALPVLA